jgi:hypothetical protein
MVGSFADGAGEQGPYRWFNGTVAPLDDDGVTANDNDYSCNIYLKLHVAMYVPCGSAQTASALCEPAVERTL